VSKNWLQVFISDQARKEILEWPLEIRKDLGSILTKLQKGTTVGYPDTKPINTVAPGVFEIRLKDASGAFRAFYVIKTKHGVVVFHSFMKKTQKTPKQEIETGRLRLNAYLKELSDESE
jgi:phage-related protein